MLDDYVVINAECAFGAAAPAAIFAGVQPSRLTLRGLPLSGGVAPGYSQYSLPGWIVLLANGLSEQGCCAGLPCRVAVQGCRVGLLCRVAVQGFECSLCRVCVGFVYSLRLKLYISQRAEYQRNVGLNVGFVYSLYSFFVSPFIYV